MIKVINILPDSPIYEVKTKNKYFDGKQDISDSCWKDIFMDEWLDQLGNAILELNNDFVYEVWQPDLNRDRIYSHTFKNGLIHKLFPAKNKKRMHGVKVINEIYSKDMLSTLQENTYDNFIINLNGNLCSLLNKNILAQIQNKKIIFTFHGEINLPATKFFNKTKNLPCKINLLLEHFWIINHINKINYITYQNDKNLGSLKKVFKGKLEKITMGCDFSFWRKIDKTACREELDLPLNRYIMITIARFVNLKQIDKFIKILIKLSSAHNFLYIAIGYGDKKYEEYLRQVAEPLLKRGKVQFVGYTKREVLLKYLNSADLYVSTSESEGASVSVMQAFACELPVFSTQAGQTAELMEKDKAGLLVGVKNYKEWEEKLTAILKNKELPKVLNRETAKKYYDWGNIAKRFISIYQNLN